MAIKFGSNKILCGKCGSENIVSGEVKESIKCSKCGNILVNKK